MSKICYLVVPSLKIEMQCLRSSIEKNIEGKGYAAFFSFSYSEPILESYREDFLICSISDKLEYDNCEMLLLPDDCTFNGKKNEKPFYSRMRELSEIINHIINKGHRPELFIGLSGDSYEDYEEISITAKEFPKTAEALLNNTWDKEVHFLFDAF